VSPEVVDDGSDAVDDSLVGGLKDVVAEPEVEEILVELGDCIEEVATAEVVVDPPGVVDIPGLEGAGEDSVGVGVLDGPASNVDEEENEEEKEDEEEDDEDEEEVAGHSSLSVPVRGPAPMQ